MKAKGSSSEWFCDGMAYFPIGTYGQTSGPQKAYFDQFTIHVKAADGTKVKHGYLNVYRLPETESGIGNILFYGPNKIHSENWNTGMHIYTADREILTGMVMEPSSVTSTVKYYNVTLPGPEFMPYVDYKSGSYPRKSNCADFYQVIYGSVY